MPKTIIDDATKHAALSRQLFETAVGDIKRDVEGVKQGVSWIRKAKKQIDESTGYLLAEQLHKIIAQANEGLAVLEEVKRVRIAQKTSKIGGGRRKG